GAGGKQRKRAASPLFSCAPFTGSSLRLPKTNMRRSLFLTAAALLLSAFPATCYYAPRWAERLADGPALQESEEAVRRAARANLEALRARHGDAPPETWPPWDREVRDAARRTLRALGEAP